MGADKSSLLQDAPKTLVGSIFFTPWTAPDGQVQVGQEDVFEPYAIEIDRDWVHLVAYEGPMSSRRMVRSWPSSQVSQISWKDA